MKSALFSSSTSLKFSVSNNTQGRARRGALLLLLSLLASDNTLLAASSLWQPWRTKKRCCCSSIFSSFTRRPPAADPSSFPSLFLLPPLLLTGRLAGLLGVGAYHLVELLFFTRSRFFFSLAASSAAAFSLTTASRSFSLSLPASSRIAASRRLAKDDDCSLARDTRDRTVPSRHVATDRTWASVG